MLDEQWLSVCGEDESPEELSSNRKPPAEEEEECCVPKWELEDELLG
jgi:hypothetical protein